MKLDVDHSEVFCYDGISIRVSLTGGSLGDLMVGTHTTLTWSDAMACLDGRPHESAHSLCMSCRVAGTIYQECARTVPGHVQAAPRPRGGEGRAHRTTSRPVAPGPATARREDSAAVPDQGGRVRISVGGG